jgi:Arc/MetJ-type ribon-helix-helix transcriptional regulator
MARVQVNLKLDEGIVKEVERLVEQGYFSSKTEAFMKALQLLLRAHKTEELVKRLEDVREETENMPSLTEAVIESHEEEDEL